MISLVVDQAEARCLREKTTDSTNGDAIDLQKTLSVHDYHICECASFREYL